MGAQAGVRSVQEARLIYFDERWITISWDEDLQAVVAEWKAFAETKDFRAGLEAGLSLARKKMAIRWLADTRRAPPSTQEDQQWTSQVWFPRAIAQGVRWMALVVPESAITRMSLRGIMTKVTSKELVQEYFPDAAAARAWLASVR
ncbi:hypothetical protein [Sorangium sp. So ce388]|uniref:hypothetical protein n=1 Tax=Sorangium sp. So ce388 TaxID=3133309 RepID=UPI003F5BD37D